MTISRDLANLSKTDKSKSAKTAMQLGVSQQTIGRDIETFITVINVKGHCCIVHNVKGQGKDTHYL
jgi:hypothetical protein